MSGNGQLIGCDGKQIACDGKLIACDGQLIVVYSNSFGSVFQLISLCFPTHHFTKENPFFNFKSGLNTGIAQIVNSLKKILQKKKILL